MEHLFEPYTIDSVEWNKRYMDKVIQEDWWDSKWKNYKEWFTNHAIYVIMELDIKSIIYVGVYTGFDYKILQEKFNMTGIDICNYSGIDHLIGDCRKLLPKMNQEFDMMWNGIGPWPWSVESKMACFNYAKKYTRYYYDHFNTKNDMPEILEDKTFKVKLKDFLLMEKE